MKLAESKRAFAFGERWSYGASSIGTGDLGWDAFISNAFGFLTVGPGDAQFTGNVIQSPLLAWNGSVTVDWNIAYTAFGTIPTVLVDLYLIAMPDQLPTTISPRLTAIAEDNTIFMKPVVYNGRIDGQWTLNGQSVRVIKRKRLTIMGPDQQQKVTTRRLKMKKRMRGKYTYDTTFDGATGQQSQTSYLRGMNYYWLCVSAYNRTPTIATQAINGIQVFGDRYVYYKDF